MSTYLITGATGFIGRRVLAELLATSPDATIHALVRRNSISRLNTLIANIPGGDRVHPVVGDLTAPGLGISSTDGATGDDLHIDHVIHLAAIYDMTADAETQREANVEGTRKVAEFALAHDAMLHHISSIAVAGDHRGSFTEDDFDLGQKFPTPYHQTKFEAEKVVRELPGLSWRVYRPSVVVGDSRTGEMDKIDGPYYFFGLLSLLGSLPAALRIPMPNLGHINLVPVDYVVDALAAILDIEPQVSGRVYHLSDPRSHTVTEMYNALTPGFSGPKGFNVVPNLVASKAMGLLGIRGLRTGRDLLATQEGIPPALLDALTLPVKFRAKRSAAILSDLGVTLPDLVDYGPRLWTYWRENLDPGRHRRPDPRGPLVGKVVLITGGSSGIGKATARMCVARGADVIVLARHGDELNAAAEELNSTPPKDGVPQGHAYPYVCDITDEEAIQTTVKAILSNHGHVDVLVNNAGRSIRRTTLNTVDRSHDHHRVMAVNYFGAVNLVLALLPQMTARQCGHVVNVTSIAVQSRGGRFGAYAASKAALEAFSDSTAVETLSDHVTFTQVRLPLVRTRMIAPTEAYQDAIGVWNVDKAASRVLDGILNKPLRVSTPLGDLADLGHRFAPRLTTRVLHQEFLLGEESAASLGNKAARPSQSEDNQGERSKGEGTESEHGKT